jgi:hypothetical protein
VPDGHVPAPKLPALPAAPGLPQPSEVLATVRETVQALPTLPAVDVPVRPDGPTVAVEGTLQAVQNSVGSAVSALAATSERAPTEVVRVVSLGAGAGALGGRPQRVPASGSAQSEGTGVAWPGDDPGGPPAAGMAPAHPSGHSAESVETGVLPRTLAPQGGVTPTQPAALEQRTRLLTTGESSRPFADDGVSAPGLMTAVPHQTAAATPQAAEQPARPADNGSDSPWLPSVSSALGGAAASAASSGYEIPAALIVALLLVAPRLGRLLRPTPDLWRPPAYISSLDRPG